MFNATEFTYDGIYSGKYGLKIASFNDDTLNETSYVVPNVIVGKSARSKKFNYLDLVYENPPTFEFSVVSESAIHDSILRDILMWLDSRKGFKPLTIMQPGLEENVYGCIFTVTNLIYHSGNCVGLNLSATFDSPYVTGKPIKLTVVGNGQIKEVDLYNDSDNVDEYIYPDVEFNSTNGKISIINTTDDNTREFAFDGVASDTSYKVNNELKIITGDGDDLLSKFSKKWLRVVRGKNHLKILINGKVTITCPRYIRIRF